MFVGVLNPGKRKAAKLLNAYVQAARGRVYPVDRMRASRLGADRWVFYGVDDVTLPLYQLAQDHGGACFDYIDNGYLRSKYQGGKPPYYRITRGAAQHHGQGRTDGARFESLGIPLKPWRRDGRHVLIALQSEWWFSRHSIDRREWIAQISEYVSTVCRRPVVVRDKPPRIDLVRPIGLDLVNAWCVVTHSSNVAIDAILAGIPAIVLGPSAAAPMAGHRIDQIDNPPTPKGREHWCGVLADNQWTLEEIATGLPFRGIEKSWRARLYGHG